MKIGVTGHQSRPGIDWTWTKKAVLDELQNLPSKLTGYSSLAAGADQLFAEVVLELGGALVAIIPSPDYAGNFSKETLSHFFDLKDRATSVECLRARETDEQSFLNAGQRICQLVDCVVAVWDGKPAEGPGGTADIVDYALALGKPVVHIDPIRRTKRHIHPHAIVKKR